MEKVDSFYRDMQQYMAISTIGPSTLRNQGVPGVIKVVREFLTGIDLHEFQAKDEKRFLQELNAQTKRLMEILQRLREQLHHKEEYWGSARKALNLFLRDLCYNRFLCERYDFAHMEGWMEIPLDSYIAHNLRDKFGKMELKPWDGLINLKPEVSDKYQKCALKLAKELDITRVHLDMILWMRERGKIERA